MKKLGSKQLMWLLQALIASTYLGPSVPRQFGFYTGSINTYAILNECPRDTEIQVGEGQRDNIFQPGVIHKAITDKGEIELAPIAHNVSWLPLSGSFKENISWVPNLYMAYTEILKQWQ